MEVVRCWSRSNLPKPSDPASRLLTPRRLPVLVELQLLQWHTSPTKSRGRATRAGGHARGARALHMVQLYPLQDHPLWTYMIPTLTTPMKIQSVPWMLCLGGCSCQSPGDLFPVPKSPTEPGASGLGAMPGLTVNGYRIPLKSP